MSQVREQRCERAVGGQAHGVLVGSFEGVHEANDERGRGRRSGVAQTVQSVGHIRSSQGRAVMEGDALTDIEDPSGFVDLLPTFS